ncbi:hypothetical protein QQP08_005361 [Theobroma cacao]|nr:hypothetical protein QQP08_005361 [Theobroma cacao]
MTKLFEEAWLLNLEKLSQKIKGIPRAVGYEDPRVTLHFGDGVAYLEAVPQGTYDAIIVDSSYLIERLFVQVEWSVLKHKVFGYICTYIIEDIEVNYCQIFNCAWITIPTFPSGINTWNGFYFSPTKAYKPEMWTESWTGW